MALALLDRGVVRIGLSLQDEITAIQPLFKRYDNVPASLADACLVRMSEMHPASRVFTLDSDFHIYRQHGRRVIPLIQPGWWRTCCISPARAAPRPRPAA